MEMYRFKESDMTDEEEKKYHFIGMSLYAALTEDDRKMFGERFDKYLTETHKAGLEITPFWMYCLEHLQVVIKD